MADPYNSGNADNWHQVNERDEPQATDEIQHFKVTSASGELLDVENRIRVHPGGKRIHHPRLKATGELLRFVARGVLVDSQKNEYEIQD